MDEQEQPQFLMAMKLFIEKRLPKSYVGWKWDQALIIDYNNKAFYLEHFKETDIGFIGTLIYPRQLDYMYRLDFNICNPSFKPEAIIEWIKSH